jgi:hypothetical protein
MHIRPGDTRPWDDRIIAPAGTTITSVTLELVNPAGRLHSPAITVTVVDAAEGTISIGYEAQSSSFVPGEYKGRYRVTLSDGTIMTVPSPDEDYPVMLKVYDLTQEPST